MHSLGSSTVVQSVHTKLYRKCCCFSLGQTNNTMLLFGRTFLNYSLSACKNLTSGCAGVIMRKVQEGKHPNYSVDGNASLGQKE